ncbi:unnamed protein product [Effrenium voratum]|nr:unnamed protein product [Effrenium voratum]
MVRIFLLRQDPPLTHAGLWQARLTAERLKELAIERPAVLTSPALRCVQTARVLCRALQALLIVEPKLSDWTEVSEETWEMAQVRYEATLAGCAGGVAAGAVDAEPLRADGVVVTAAARLLGMAWMT